MGPPYHIYAFGHGEPLQIFRKIAVAKLANKRLVAYQVPGADPGGDVGDASSTSHFQQCFGYIKFFYNFELLYNHGTPPIIRQHPLPNIFMSQNWTSAKVMTFFWSSLHFRQKLGIWERYDLFFGLHFIVGIKLDICRRVNFAKSSPPVSKNGRFC